MAEDIGIEAAAVHPRTRTQGYTGKADWDLIARIKQAVKIPIIGNGDIQTPEDAERMVQQTGLRRGDDWARRGHESVDFFANGTVPAHRALQPPD